MTFDTKNYVGPGAAGAAAPGGAATFPGPNAAGAAKRYLHGRGAAGTPDSRPQTLSGDQFRGAVVGLDNDPSAAVGVTDFTDASNGTLVEAAYPSVTAAAGDLAARNINVVYGPTA